jgi:hypothetical protein
MMLERTLRDQTAKSCYVNRLNSNHSQHRNHVHLIRRSRSSRGTGGSFAEPNIVSVETFNTAIMLPRYYCIRDIRPDSLGFGDVGPVPNGRRGGDLGELVAIATV